MPPWLPIAISIVVAVLSVIANMKIKFAPSEDVAKRELTLFVFRVIQWICGLASAVSLVYIVFFSSAPLTRVTVFAIAFGVATLMFVVVMCFINHIYRLLNKISKNVMLVDENSELRQQASELRLKVDQLKSSLQDIGKVP